MTRITPFLLVAVLSARGLSEPPKQVSNVLIAEEQAADSERFLERLVLGFVLASKPILRKPRFIERALFDRIWRCGERLPLAPMAALLGPSHAPSGKF